MTFSEELHLSFGANFRWLLTLIPLLFRRFSALSNVLRMFLLHTGHSFFVGLSTSPFTCGGIYTSIGCLPAFGSSYYRYHHCCNGLPVTFKEYCCGNSHSRAIRCRYFFSHFCRFQRRKCILHSARLSTSTPISPASALPPVCTGALSSLTTQLLVWAAIFWHSVLRSLNIPSVPNQFVRHVWPSTWNAAA